MSCLPWVDRAWGYPRFPKHATLRQNLQMVARLRKERFDVLINLNGSDRSSWLTFLSGAQARLGRRPRDGGPPFWGRMFTEFVQYNSTTEPVYLQKCRCLEQAGFPFTQAEFHAHVDPAHLQAAGITKAEAGTYFHLSPFTTADKKELSPAQTAELIGTLETRFPEKRWVLSGAPTERERKKMEALVAGLRHKPWRVFAGELNLVQLAAVIEHSAVHLCGDTGTLHLALMTGTPSVSWFRSGVGTSAWIPSGNQHRTVLGEEGVEGSYLRGIDTGALVGAVEAVLRAPGTDQGDSDPSAAGQRLQAQQHLPASSALRATRGDGKLLIVGLRCGRLGNRIVLFANLIAYAAEHGYRLVNVTFHSYAAFFETTRRDVYCRYPIATQRSLLDLIPGVAGAIRRTRIFYHVVRGVSVLNDKCPLFGKRVVTLRERPGQLIILLETPEVWAQIEAARVVFVYGWIFRAPELVQKHAEAIRAYFRPVESYERLSAHAVAPLRQNAEVVIGVHIRQGDYRHWKKGACFFTMPQYAAWMRGLAEQLLGRRVSFLLCSDEPRRQEEFPGLAVGFGPGCPMGDLYALARCDYILGTLSSFSQWASFYGNKPLYQVRDGADHPEIGKFRVSYLDDIPR